MTAGVPEKIDTIGLAPTGGCRVLQEALPGGDRRLVRLQRQGIDLLLDPPERLSSLIGSSDERLEQRRDDGRCIPAIQVTALDERRENTPANLGQNHSEYVDHDLPPSLVQQFRASMHSPRLARGFYRRRRVPIVTRVDDGERCQVIVLAEGETLSTANWVMIGVAILVALLLGGIVGGSLRRGSLPRWLSCPLDERKPTFFFLFSLFYLAALILVLIAQWKGWIDVPELIPGVVPAAIPWFGALGAVTISLYGVFDHNQEWDAKWNPWHLARPFVGAILGTLAVMIFVGFINAAGLPTDQGAPKDPIAGTTTTTVSTPASGASDSEPEPAPGRTARDDLPYLVVAFVVGFREETFRKLIKRVVDVILGPGIPGETPPASALITPSPLPFRGVQKDAEKAKTLRVTNNGTGNLYVNPGDRSPAGVALKVEGDLKVFTLENDNVTGAVIPPGSFAEVSVRYKRPDNDTEHRATITINTNAGARTVNVLGHQS